VDKKQSHFKNPRLILIPPTLPFGEGGWTKKKRQRGVTSSKRRRLDFFSRPPTIVFYPGDSNSLQTAQMLLWQIFSSREA
jgi:hypothetical protein